MKKYHYILEKIKEAKFLEEPYKHLYIENFLSEEDLSDILGEDQIHFQETESTKELVTELQKRGYEITGFPGCTTDLHEYLRCCETNDFKHLDKQVRAGLLAGVGVAFRLKNSSTKNENIRNLIDFMNSDAFREALEEKFEMKQSTEVISAIQKYLTKYEISPHPDVRKKALTYLVNINTSKEKDIHTHMLKLKPEYQYIEEYWDKNPHIDRPWVPWSWCDTKKIHSQNNSIIIFQPNNKTFHAVKLDYDHKTSQRTQIYGNLMYKNPPRYQKSHFLDLKKLK